MHKGSLGAWLALGLLLALALLGPWLAPYDPKQVVSRPFQSPSAQHWLGTNDLGQDILSELLAGARVSLAVGFSAAFTALVLGLLVGLIAGYNTGWLGAALMRLADLILVLPFLPLIIVVAAYLGPSLWNLVLLIGLLFWARPARVIRAAVLGVRGMAFVEAAVAMGGSSAHILRYHLLPAVLPVAFSQLILLASNAILLEASLSFLGLGDPTQKSWGSMLFYAQVRGAFLNGSWPWWALPPGLLITLSVLALAAVGRELERRAAAIPS
jgi:peptide/nickel transport system ATP-binding protein/peptide/nickel transport system permease protein